MNLRHIACIAAFVSGSCLAASVPLPGGTLTVPGTSTTGASFTYSGTLTQNDTIAFTQTGNPCLQNPISGYCVNGAGVLTVAAIFVAVSVFARAIDWLLQRRPLPREGRIEYGRREFRQAIP